MGMFMDDSKLFELIEKLPHIPKCQVQHLVIGLVIREKEGGSTDFDQYNVLMADDFNDPMKEFHDYMYTISVDFVNKIEKLPISKQKIIEKMVDEMLTLPESQTI